ILLFFVITAAAVGFVYLYVVPQLESNLTAQRLSRLEDRSSLQTRRLERAMNAGLSEGDLESLLRRVSQLTDARVTLLGIPPGENRPSFVVGDSEVEGEPLSGGFEVATRAAGGESAAGVETLAGERTAEVATPI